MTHTPALVDEFDVLQRCFNRNEWLQLRMSPLDEAHNTALDPPAASILPPEPTGSPAQTTTEDQSALSRLGRRYGRSRTLHVAGGPKIKGDLKLKLSRSGHDACSGHDVDDTTLLGPDADSMTVVGERKRFWRC